MALMPMILMIVIIAGILLIEIPALNGSSAEEGLKTAAYSVSAGLNAMDGDFKVTRGQLFKGNTVFANDNALFTEINEKTGAEIVLFYGIDSYATTIKDSEGNYVKKLTADEQTVDTVKSMDGYLFDRNAEYADCKYYGCYVPLKQGSSGVNVGMIFVGIPKNNVRKGMFIGLIISAVLVIAVIVVSVIITLRDAKRLPVASRHRQNDLNGCLHHGRIAFIHRDDSLVFPALLFEMGNEITQECRPDPGIFISSRNGSDSLCGSILMMHGDLVIPWQDREALDSLINPLFHAE